MNKKILLIYLISLCLVVLDLLAGPPGFGENVLVPATIPNIIMNGARNGVVSRVQVNATVRFLSGAAGAGIQGPGVHLPVIVDI